MSGKVAVVFLFTLSSSFINKGYSCTQGFPSFEQVSQLVQTCGDSCVRRGNGNKGLNTVIPGMNFTCTGTIIKWRVAGDLVEANAPSNLPGLQIWRPQPTTNTYSIAAEVPLLDCGATGLVTVSQDVHECDLSPGVEVMPGDILGIYLTRANNDRFSRLSVYYDSTSTDPPLLTVHESIGDPETVFPFGGTTVQRLPLVALQVESTEDGDVTTTSLVDQTNTANVQTGLGVTTSDSMESGVVTTNTAPEIETGGGQPTSSVPTTKAGPPSETTIQDGDTDSMATAINNVTPTTGTQASTQENMATAPRNDVVIIVGVVIGVLLVILIAVFLAMFVYRVCRTRAKKLNPGYLNPRISEDYPDVGNYEEIEMTSHLSSRATATSKHKLLPVRGSRTSSPGDDPRVSKVEFEVLNNPSYTLGLYVPSMEQRNTLSPESDYYEALGLKQSNNGQASSPTQFFSESDTYWEPASDSQALYGQLSDYKYREIPRSQIRTTEELGSGQFGEVNKGLWQISPDNALECAVKTLHAEATEEDCVAFLQEAAINGQFHHPNVVQLLGVVTVGEPVMIVLELLSNGDLLAYLRKTRPSPGELVDSNVSRLLLRFCQQVASGMEYLSRKGFVHRDLAARNILVTSDKTCKISDFGMSRDMAGEYYISKGGKVPVKWTAPEALHYKKYSTASDVWSFGALMYEIWSLGCKPFQDYSNFKVIELVDSGFRLPPPPGCPRLVYQLMIECWNPTSKQRPSFHSVGERLNVSEVELMASEEELDAGCDSSAMMLGAPLSAATNLHRELQQTYLSTVVDPDYSNL